MPSSGIPALDSAGTPAIDLDAYLRRVGWSGSLRPDLATLAGLLEAHMRAIPFENLDVLLGRGISLELPALEAKLVHARRGGYCFEHATLFAAVLRQLGFAPRAHVARVILTLARDAAARTHMVLCVPIDRELHLVDPGFGGLAPLAPLPLVDGRRVQFGGDAHWMKREGTRWVMCAQVGDEVHECWIAALDDDNPVDFEMGNHFTATHPSSAFRQRLMLRALTPTARVSVLDREVTLRGEGGRVERRTLADRGELRALLARDFGFDLPEVEAMRVPAVPGWA